MRKRKRYQAGSVTRNKRYWLGKYRDENGKDRTVVLGKLKGKDAITKSKAREKLDDIVKPVNATANDALPTSRDTTMKDYIENVYFPFKRKSWRKLTNESRTDSITLHIIGKFGPQPVASMNRDELQRWLDGLVTKKDPSKLMAYSTLDHLRWDLKDIFDLAVADKIIDRNPIYSEGMLLSVPTECPRPIRRVMSAEDVKRAISALQGNLRERAIFKLIVFSGMRMSEVFGLRRGRVAQDYVEIAERVCRRDIDKPKSEKAQTSSGIIEHGSGRFATLA